MIWSILICISLGLASARKVENVSPEHLEELRSSGQDEEFARLLRIDVNLVRPTDERSEGSRYNLASPLGDIILTEEQERNLINPDRHREYQWNCGRVPVVISSDFTQEQIDLIVEGIMDLNSKLKYVVVVPRKNEKDYIYIFPGEGCYSALGRTGDQQPLSLQPSGCITRGTVQHELLHALGMHHEHNRYDRDDHLIVLWDHIQKVWWSQYEKVGPDSWIVIGCYDYDSIMHYPMWSPGQPHLDSFEILSSVNRSRLGQDEGVSEKDIAKLNMYYRDAPCH